MTIRHLQIFRTVCDCQSITAAADKLGMTQPAVSIAIRELESFYQTKLFDRLHRRIYLTEAGLVLRQYTDMVLEQLDEATAVLRDKGNFMTCRLGVNITIGETILPELLELLQREIPTIQLEVIVNDIRTIERKLTDNEVDFIIVDILSNDEHVITAPIYTGNMVVVCSPTFYSGDSITVRELAEQKLLLREVGTGNRICTDAVFHAHGCPVRPIVASMSDLCLINLAKRGFGMTVMPEELVAESIAAGQLKAVKVKDGIFQRHYFLAYHERKYMTTTMKKVIAVLKSYRNRDRNEA